MMNIITAKASYTRRTFGIALLYVGAVFGNTALYHAHLVQPLFVVPLALLPGIFMACFIVNLLVYVRDERDEYQRYIIVQNILLTTLLHLSLLSVWGFLALDHVIADLPAFLASSGWFVAFALVTVTRRALGR